MVASAVGGLAGFFFAEDEVTNYEEAKATDEKTYAALLPGHAGDGRLSTAVALRGAVPLERPSPRNTWTV